MRRLYVLLASVVIATLLIASAAPAQHPPPPPPKYYGALWVSPSLQTSYWGQGGTREGANRQAYSSCLSAATDCRAGVWVRNGYAAFAMDPARAAWGTGWGHTELQAVQEALTVCQTFGGVACHSTLQTYKTRVYMPGSSTIGGIPRIPQALYESLPPSFSGLGAGGRG